MKVAILTEGLGGTGYGHLTRCLSLYQAFEEKNIVPQYIANCDENANKFIGNIDFLKLDWLNNLNELFETVKDYDIAIIDSYLAPLEIYEQIQKLVKKVVYIDDYVRLEYPPGVIVNGTIGAENLPYKKDNEHEYLLGIDYMPLRKEFWDIEIPKKENKEIQNVLITFGGQDFRNLTFPILDFLLEKYPALNYHVVKGIAENESTIKNKYQGNINFYESLNAKEMLGLMLKCDLAVTAAGQTMYELARVGLKPIAIGIADNQRFNIKGWLGNNFIYDEIWYNDDDYFNKLSRSFKQLINTVRTANIYCDGLGSRRVCQVLVN